MPPGLASIIWHQSSWDGRYTRAARLSQTDLCTRASAVERLLDEFTGTSARYSITQIQGWACRGNGESNPTRGPTVTAVSPVGGDGDLPREGKSPGFAVVVLILSLTLLLMGFSVCAVLLNQTALAALAGTSAVGLAGETVRRVLTSSASRHPDSPASPVIDADPPQPR